MNNEVYEQLDDLKKIKKEYGENMSHLCRELFSTILEKPGLLFHIISSHFAKSKKLCEDIVNENKKYEFKNYIYYLYDEMMNLKQNKENHKSVRELLREKGYTLYECKTNEDIQRFRKYYANGEELCTFRDPNRINNYYIFFIVKDNADTLDRRLFTSPKREDEYSISVLDLQFDKGNKQRVSIKSRYNHTVSNPDATYSNNLGNIAEGLTEAFEREYNFNIGNEYKVNFELDHYIKAKDNKYYKYNYEINNIHYCPNNIIIDNGKVIDTYSNKSRYTFMDYFILDEVEKKIIMYDTRIHDSFIDGLDNITNIEITKQEEYKKITLKLEEGKEAIIKLDSNGRIIEYENNYLRNCGDNFLCHNKFLQELSLPNLQKCGKFFLCWNKSLQELSLPNLQNCGNYFLCHNKSLQRLSLPNLQSCGDDFLHFNNSLQELILPNLKRCGSNFLYINEPLQELSLPNLQSCGDDFLHFNNSLQELTLPNLQSCGDDFLYVNESLQELSLPNLKRCGSVFLYFNNSLQELSLHNLQSCGDNFLLSNNSLQELSLPNLQQCGSNFLYFNKSLQELSLPNLQECGNDFLYSNESLQELSLPNLHECGSNFLYSNESLQELSSPNLKKLG